MQIFDILQLVTAILLIIAILLQHRSAGIGMSFGGGGGAEGYYTRRGFEKFLTQATVVLAAAFIAVSFARIAL